MWPKIIDFGKQLFSQMQKQKKHEEDIKEVRQDIEALHQDFNRLRQEMNTTSPALWNAWLSKYRKTERIQSVIARFSD